MSDVSPAVTGTVFIVTYGRSGSTLLQNLLNALPGVCVRGENYFAVQPLFESWRRVDLAHQDFAANYSAVHQPWFGADLMKPDAYAQDLVAAFLKNVVQPPEGTRWVGFKEIRYNNAGRSLGAVLDFMNSYFPNPRFIFNIRNAESVAKSGWFQNRSAEDTVAMVNYMNEQFMAQIEARPDVSVLVDYDKFVEDPEHIRSIFDLLGIDYDESLVRGVLEHRLSH